MFIVQSIVQRRKKIVVLFNKMSDAKPTKEIQVFKPTPGIILVFSGVSLLVCLLIYLYVNAAVKGHLGLNKKEGLQYNLTVSTTIAQSDEGVWEFALPLITALLCSGVAMLKPQWTKWSSVFQVLPIALCFSLISILRKFHNNPNSADPEKPLNWGDANVVHGVITLIALFFVGVSMGWNFKVKNSKWVSFSYLTIFLIGMALITANVALGKKAEYYNARHYIMNSFAVAEWGMLICLGVHLVLISMEASKDTDTFASAVVKTASESRM